MDEVMSLGKRPRAGVILVQSTKWEDQIKPRNFLPGLDQSVVTIYLQIAEASQLRCVNVRETGLVSREGFAQLCVRVGEGLFFDPWWYYMEGEETRRYNMDFFELVKIIFARVQKLEPDNVVKIIGCILLKEPSEQEMVQLAFSSDGMLLSEISHAKNMLGLLSPKNSMLDMQASSYPPSGSRSTSSSVNFHIQTQQWDPQPAPEHHQRHNFDYVPWQYPDSVRDNYSLNKQPQPGEEVDATNHSSNYYYPEAAFTGDVSSRLTRRSQSLSDLPIKVCHYFNKGYCKHGLNCRFSHAQSFPDGYSHVFSPIMNNSANEEHSHTSKSLEKLDMEIAQLLRSKRGMPVSIASLPMLYSDKYGKCLQAEGYLTESQRHGKAGYNLTRLLSHLKNIRLIERPHGQHSVILAEDSPRYIECRNDRNSLSLTVSSSHQIYLTFPAESTFTEDDVSNYFKQYGQVRDVRIPCQDKRMFGFVSFVHPQTVNKILMKRNPHYICGARVLVKPYREKSKVMDRTYSETFKPMSDCHSQYPGMDRDAHSGENNSNFYKYVLQEPEFSRLFRYQMIEETMDHEIFCLSEMNLAPKSPTGQEPVPRGTKDPNDLSLDQISYEFDLLNDGSTAEDKARSISNPFIDDESGHIELPESLFESPPITSIFALV